MEKKLQAEIIAILKTILDPEVGVNIWDFGLIYGVLVKKRDCVQDINKSLTESEFLESSVTKMDSLANNLIENHSRQAYSCHIIMTFTSFNCPAIETLPKEITEKVGQIISPNNIKIEVVWEPRWDASLLSEEIQFELGLL